MRLFLASDVEDFRVVEMARIERRRRQSTSTLLSAGICMPAMVTSVLG
ncbi:hypothetical protein T190_11840 [Sinorhizobium meliloti CCBAU 01290]|nr:hypothetical protein T190_11840 [Sinorhizobium meliloti CCBAU 01290]